MFKSIYYIFSIFLIIKPFYHANASQVQDRDCHPKINPKLPQYIVGYGSLMLEKSKLSTDKNVGANIPVTITGFKRGWFVASKQPNLAIIYLGAVKDKMSSLNAVLFKLNDPKSLSAYDLREVGYCRVAIKDENIKSITSQKIAQGQYWVYIISNKDRHSPSKRYPIVQSYTDIFLSGCFEIEAKHHLNHFAKDCVLTTSNWSAEWVNDRINPRLIHDEQLATTKIDNLLAAEIPMYFNAIKTLNE